MQNPIVLSTELYEALWEKEVRIGRYQWIRSVNCEYYGCSRQVRCLGSIQEYGGFEDAFRV